MSEPAGIQEKPASAAGGTWILILCMIGFLGGAAVLITSILNGVAAEKMGGGQTLPILGVTVSVIVLIASLAVAGGLKAVAPKEARVLQLFGRYKGTIRADGLQWVNPLISSTKVSTRIRNHETSTIKVNDANGNPIEIAAVVVWQVADTAQAMFSVDDYVQFVSIQTETAVRQVAGSYPYDAHEPDIVSLRDNTAEVGERLAEEVADRVRAAGIVAIEARITHLAYAPEIAQAMLRRQQAGAIVAARRQIVDGAVGMVQAALAQITEQDIVDLDDERKAAMVSNLLVVLCGDQGAQPVLNTGTLYS